MASFQKYFLALVPEGELQEKVTSLKEMLKERFNIKYALKSPAHVTLKMPFTYNEAKEEYLEQRLKEFLKDYEPLELIIGGVKKFGDRVVFLNVEANEDLFILQKNLKIFCRRELTIVDELSDRNFHPHMTIAFKDLKKSQVPNIMKVLEEQPILEKFVTKHLFLLKRVDRRWINYKKIDFGSEII